MTYFLTLEMNTFPKIDMSIIPLEWYRWQKFQGLAHSLPLIHRKTIAVSEFVSKHHDIII